MKSFWRVEVLFDYEWFPLTAGFPTEADARAAVTSWVQVHNCNMDKGFRVVEYQVDTTVFLNRKDSKT